MLDNPSVTKEQVLALLDSAAPLIAAETQEIEKLKAGIAPPPALANTLNQLSNYKQLLDSMLTLPKLDPDLDHDTLAESNIVSTVQSLVKYFSILEKLFESELFSEEHKTSILAIKDPLSQTSSVFTQFISQFKEFKASEETLRQEILSYTAALEQIQKQQPNSVDWGGKKQAFEQKGTELTSRRATYVEQETKINQQIITLSTHIHAIHNALHPIIQSAIPIIDRTLSRLSNTHIPDPSILAQVTRRQHELESFLTLKDQFITVLKS
ncbi:MAG: hypothetical protein ACRCTE_10585 [Cellulosilyticaceae bacterium]